MANYIKKTILVTGPKRAGKTLLVRLFDNEPGMLHFIDEAYFWEHAFNYKRAGYEDQFIRQFQAFSPEKIYQALFERDMLPGLNGEVKQLNPLGADQKYKIKKYDFSKDIFIENLTQLKLCKTISEVWDVLCLAYASARGLASEKLDTAFMMSGDSGKSLIVARDSLPDCRGILLVRDPYLAMDSLKMSRVIRGEKRLNPVNYSKVLTYYRFITDNKDQILNNNNLLVRYEDLISNPKEVMLEISSHCDIAFSENLITPTLAGTPWGTNSIYSNSAGIDRFSTSREIQALDREEIDFVSEFASDYIRYFGYNFR